jgi:hypothetical protein
MTSFLCPFSFFHGFQENRIRTKEKEEDGGTDLSVDPSAR